MNNLTNAKIALIAAAASVLTSAIHGGFQAVFEFHNSSVPNVIGFMFGRVIGDVPIAVLCFGMVYGWLYLRKAK